MPRNRLPPTSITGLNKSTLVVVKALNENSVAMAHGGGISFY